MSRSFYRVAPAGSPIRPRDLARWATALASDRDASGTLAQALSDRFGARRYAFVSTGRAALTVILRAMRTLAPDRHEVIIPSYTCYSVAASVVKADLVPRIVDIDPQTLDFEQDRLLSTDTTRAVALVATNLYGLPNDMPFLRDFAQTRGMFLVDDAAQALGASSDGRYSGTWGDAGLYSFDKGKNLTSLDGGIIISNEGPLATAIDREVRGLSRSASGATSVRVMKALAYAALLHPRMYWIPAGIPGLGLGFTRYDTTFPLERGAPTLAALALTMLDRLEEYTRQRQANAAALAEGLTSLGLQLIRYRSSAQPVFVRFPVLMPHRVARDLAIEKLQAEGIGATGSYPEALADVPELRAHAPLETMGGRTVASRILTLPTHPYVTPSDIARTVSTLAEILSSGATAPLAQVLAN
jgi:dTDP-4-amino-4,6-dideoxygalactose transaminase